MGLYSDAIREFTSDQVSRPLLFDDAVAQVIATHYAVACFDLRQVAKKQAEREVLIAQHTLLELFDMIRVSIRTSIGCAKCEQLEECLRSRLFQDLCNAYDLLGEWLYNHNLIGIYMPSATYITNGAPHE